MEHPEIHFAPRYLVICYNCEGRGTNLKYCGDHHKSDYEYKPCECCKGKGRLWCETTYKPMEDDNGKH